ncbi:GNAT family N-acetyltransferase [Marinomonas ostreistagni]|uniref:GNAT family N-acetyltransferase n=1 Tax=Marinomonas ostreistagni TaxID=359209 RepID=UPI00194FF93D|nr:GNAT family N-acetyltransferase [Marinomonas ostreistagni]MBM6549664.1 N-acetyltransferase [Marinomonas ostreistagni]
MNRSPSFVVRLAEIADAPQILSIFLQSEAQAVFKTGVSLASVVEWLDSASPEHPFWVVEANAVVVGWCALEPFYGLPSLVGAQEIAIYIDQAFHGQGAGRSLLEHVISQQASLKLHSLVAYTLANNQASQAFFSAQGFSQWGCLPQLARSQGQVCDLLMLGRQLS